MSRCHLSQGDLDPAARADDVTRLSATLPHRADSAQLPSSSEERWATQSKSGAGQSAGPVEMLPKIFIIVVTLLIVPVLGGSSPAGSGLIGSPAPYFSVQSGNNEELTLDMILGKVAAIFYENKDIVSANKRLKDELSKLYFEQADTLKERLARLPIIDCSEAVWAFRPIWKRRLREYSKREGMTIYCDWSGKMASDYKMKNNVSNVIIIDKSGRIRFFTSGDVAAEEIDDLKRLLIALTKE